MMMEKFFSKKIIAIVFFLTTSLCAQEKTQQYIDLKLRNESLTYEEIRYLKEHVIIFLVPGFMSKPFSKDSLPRSFTAAREWLKETGIEYRDIKVHSQGATDDNRLVIKEELDKTEKQVILVGHSKGTLENLSTLLHFEEVRSKILAMVPIQGVFHGTPIADSVAQSFWLRNLAKPLLSLFGTHHDTVQNLSCERRKKHLEKWKQTIQELTQKIYVLSVVTSMKKNPYPFAGAFFAEDSDGVVPTASGILPGSDYIKLEELSHTDLVDQSQHGPSTKIEGPDGFQQKTFFQMILKMILTHR
jgi:hypothetical protein